MIWHFCHVNPGARIGHNGLWGQNVCVANRTTFGDGDETSLSTSDPRGRGFAPRGQTPVLTVVSRRKSVSFLSTVTNQGTVRFMVLEGPLSAQILMRFLRRRYRCR